MIQKIDGVTETEKLRQLDTLVLTDPCPDSRVNAIYLLTQTADNQRSVFERGVELHLACRAPIVIIDDKAKKRNWGYPGATRWRRKLVSMGVPESSIITIACTESLNTLTESLAFAKYAKSQGWNRVVIVAPPFHQSRAFFSVVTAAAHYKTRLHIYNQAGTVLCWNRVARHSQGKDKMKRFMFPLSEGRRINSYQKVSIPITLLGTDEVIRYILRRGRK